MSKKKYCDKEDCLGCAESCISYPGILHADGVPFCKKNFSVIVKSLVEYKLIPGVMIPEKEKDA